MDVLQTWHWSNDKLYKGTFDFHKPDMLLCVFQGSRVKLNILPINLSYIFPVGVWLIIVACTYKKKVNFKNAVREPCH